MKTSPEPRHPRTCLHLGRQAACALALVQCGAQGTVSLVNDSSCDVRFQLDLHFAHAVRAGETRVVETSSGQHSLYFEGCPFTVSQCDFAVADGQETRVRFFNLGPEATGVTCPP